MARMITFHSFRRGTGRTNLLAGVAGLLAAQGKRVGVLDADLQSPAAHILFGLREQEIRWTLTDFLFGDCALEQIVYRVQPRSELLLRGQIFLAPASTNVRTIMRLLHDGFEVDALNSAFSGFARAFDLDVLLVDTSAGLREDTLIELAVADCLVLVVRLDRQDYQGTGVLFDLAKRLDLDDTRVVVNNVPPAFSLSDVRHEVEQNYGCKVDFVLPHSPELLALAGGGIFPLCYPDDPFSHSLRKIAEELT
jgi:septum site-determining protein MinD